MKNSALIMGLAWVALCLAVVLLGMSLALSPLELSLLPIPLSAAGLTPLTGAAWAAAVALLWVAAGHARGLGAQVPFAQLILYFPLLLAGVWLVHRPNQTGTADYLLLGAALLAALALLKAGPPRGTAGAGGARFWVWDVAVIALPALLGLAMGVRPDLRAAGLSLLLYPAYALVQLAVFLILPARRLPRLGLGTTAAAALSAAVFALVHAPNLVVMAVTGAAMFIWCRQYLQGRPVWRLAVVMGLAATVFSQFLADDFTGHMRVGPGYTRALALENLAAAGSQDSEMLPHFLERIYPGLLERDPTPDELAAWQRTLTRARLTGLATQFFHSEEYRRKAARRGWPLPPGTARHWTEYPPEWRIRIAAFGDPEYLERCGQGWTDFLLCLYRDILQRQPGDAELAAWTRQLTSNERRAVARAILDHRLSWRRAPFSGLPVSELRLRR